MILTKKQSSIDFMFRIEMIMKLRTSQVTVSDLISETVFDRMNTIRTYIGKSCFMTSFESVGNEISSGFTIWEERILSNRLSRFGNDIDWRLTFTTAMCLWPVCL